MQENEASNAGDPIKNLAVAIISNAIRDFRSKSRERIGAEDFIFERNSKLFSVYCSWIGWDPEWVRNKIITKAGRRHGRQSAVSGW